MATVQIRDTVQEAGGGFEGVVQAISGTRDRTQCLVMSSDGHQRNIAASRLTVIMPAPAPPEIEG